MKLCDDNRTYAVPNLNLREMFYITADQKVWGLWKSENVLSIDWLVQRISGMVGACMDLLFGLPHKRKCTLVGFENLGSKDPATGNYSGNLGN